MEIHGSNQLKYARTVGKWCHSEHLVTIEGTATVSPIATKLSQEAFSGITEQLLDSKTSIADT